MSARDVTIDTLDFDALVKIGLDNIPGASQREWTVHGAVDPGITILELLAWQLEQRLFMADRLTAPVIRASLTLLGLDPPAPALAAVTVLSVSTQGSPGHLAAGTVFGLDRDSGGRAFATERDIWVQPVTAVDAYGTLARDGDALELAATVDAPSLPAAGELALLVEVDAAPGVAPAWMPGAADVEPPAELRWEAVGAAGGVETVTVEDTTGAFRRSGLLRLDWPGVWNEPGPDRPLLRAVAVSASYTEPVRVLGVAPNAVVARHRIPATLDVSAQIRAFLPLPGQIVGLPGTAGLLLDGEGDVVLSVDERSGERHDWTAVRSWEAVGPDERVFLVDRDRGELGCGDGRAGRILRAADDPDAQVSFALGGGRAGNLGPYSGWSETGGPAVAVNPVAAERGDEPETLDAARERAAAALTARNRTVTEKDARLLAVETPGLGLARADASPEYDPAFPCGPVPGALAVTIVPHADRRGDSHDWTATPQPDRGAIATTAARLDRARLLGQQIFVLPPVYRAVSVEVSVSTSAQVDDAESRITETLRRHLDPLVGGSEGDGWAFGGAVRPSALPGVVQKTLGPEAEVTRLAVALDDHPWSDCSDAEIGPRELVWLKSVKVSWVAALPTGGGLR